MGDPLFLIILVLAAGAMFLMTSRTRKQQKAAQEFRNTLTPGQEIMTGSGLFGTVVDVDEENDIITVESTPGTQTRWLRAAIAKVVEPPVAEPAADEDDAAVGSAATIASANDDVIDVPDDLSGLTDERRDARKDGETDSK